MHVIIITTTSEEWLVQPNSLPPIKDRLELENSSFLSACTPLFDRAITSFSCQVHHRNEWWMFINWKHCVHFFLLLFQRWRPQQITLIFARKWLAKGHDPKYAPITKAHLWTRTSSSYSVHNRAIGARSKTFIGTPILLFTGNGTNNGQTQFVCFLLLQPQTSG